MINTIQLPTDGRATCRIRINNAPAFNAVASFASNYQGNGATPCQYIDTTGKAIDCATTLPLTAFYIMKLCSRLFVLFVEIVQKTTNVGNLSPF